MGPHRTVYERQFFLTEPAFDKESGQFFERPIRPDFGADKPQSRQDEAAPAPKILPMDTVHSHPEQIGKSHDIS